MACIRLFFTHREQRGIASHPFFPLHCLSETDSRLFCLELISSSDFWFCLKEPVSEQQEQLFSPQEGRVQTEERHFLQ